MSFRNNRCELFGFFFGPIVSSGVEVARVEGVAGDV
jgi:hypothetical protein